MLTTWRQRARREGIVLREISIPINLKRREEIVDIFARHITSRTRVMHFCHITNLSGQIYPVRELCQLARSRGIEAIVDGAHAYAHFPFQQSDLDCDFYGTSLHKWLTAPFGTGMLYVRRDKIPQVWSLMASEERNKANIRKFEEIGTHPSANALAINEALDFYEGIGAERKAARLRYLFHRWAKRLEVNPRVRIHTSYDPTQSCGLTLFDIDGVDLSKLALHLEQVHRIITTPIVHDEFRGIRITPNVYTTVREIDIFAETVEKYIEKEGKRG